MLEWNRLEYLERRIKEEKVRSVLGKEFRTKFSKKRLITDINHEFDLVSENQRIVGEVKTSEPNSRAMKGNGLRTAQLGDLARDCLLLLTVKADRRILVLTDKTVFEKFKETQYGKAAIRLGIDLRYVRA